MKFRLFVAALAAMLLAGCGVGSPTTEDCTSVRIQPQVIHMQVGQSQTFTVTGGWGDKDSYYFHFSAPENVNLEQVAPDTMKLTLVYAFNQPAYAAILTAGTQQCGSATALVYNP